MTAVPFQDHVRTLAGRRPPRVWSLLVTVFGELAQADGAKISGPMITHLMGLIGIKPEATRVALHRLKKDGWIDSSRNGRQSDYVLTAKGRAESAAASPRIYARDGVGTAWLVLRDPAEDIAAPGETVILPGVAISGVPPEGDAFGIAITDKVDLPDWMTDRTCPAAMVAQSQTFAERLDALSRSLDMANALAVDEVAALRILIIHSWRRIVLKAPPLPDPALPSGWAGARCRDDIAGFLARLGKPSLDELEHHLHR